MSNKVSWPSLASLRSRTSSIKSQFSQAGIGELFRESPGKLLGVLEATLSSSVPIDPELKDIGDVVPVFPDTVTAKDMTEFHGLLENEIFANYFNLFLNLPIFPRFVFGIFSWSLKLKYSYLCAASLPHKIHRDGFKFVYIWYNN